MLGMTMMMTDHADGPAIRETALLPDADTAELIVEIVHQFRSRFTSILVLAEMIHRAPERNNLEELRKNTGLLYGSAFAGSVLASDLMALARADDHTRVNDLAPLSISELLHSVAADLAPIAVGRGLDIQLRTVDDHERMGEPLLMRQILLDLAFVVLELCDEGQFDLIADELGGDRVEFTIGGSTERLDKATIREFDRPFEPRDGTRGWHLSPIGLAVVCARNGITRLGGELEVEPGAERGLRFRFALDLPRSAK